MNANNNFNIGNKIYKLRKLKGLSQEQLAFKSNITPAYLGLLERNVKNPTVRVLGQICDALEITFGDFFCAADAVFEDTDIISTKILAQISGCSEHEKEMLLKIVKDIVTALHSYKEN